MIYSVIRIDFTERCQCVFCSRKITSGKGYVVVNEKGEEAFCGPVCAKDKNNVINPGARIPDLTKGAIDAEERENSRKGRNMGIGDRPKLDEEIEKQNAIAYLLLRMEKLKDFPGVHYKKLDPIFMKYKANNLLEEDYNFLKILMKGEKRPEFSYKNLQAIYACNFWIDKFIKNNSNTDISFVKSLRKYLHEHLRLTEKQIEGLNKWFDRADGGGMVRIKKDVFTA